MDKTKEELLIETANKLSQLMIDYKSAMNSITENVEMERRMIMRDVQEKMNEMAAPQEQEEEIPVKTTVKKKKD